MDFYLNYLENYKENELRQQVILMVKKYSSYKRILKSHLSPEKVFFTKMPLCHIRKLPRNLKSTLKRKTTEDRFSSSTKLQKTPQGKFTYKFEEHLLIKNIFKKIAEYDPEASERGYSLFVIKQFFLDCYVCDSSFMETLVGPIKDQKFIDFHRFLWCFEHIQCSELLNSTSVKKPRDKKSTNFFRQKMLCNS